MVQLPESLSLEHLRSRFGKGDVLFWESFPGKEKSRDSFFVLLTACINDSFLVVRATAKIQLYTGSLPKRLAHEAVLIKANETPLFPKDTILDLTWIDSFTVQEMSKLLGSNIKLHGRLPDTIIQRIDEAVQISITVSEHDKKLILQA